MANNNYGSVSTSPQNGIYESMTSPFISTLQPRPYQSLPIEPTPTPTPTPIFQPLAPVSTPLPAPLATEEGFSFLKLMLILFFGTLLIVAIIYVGYTIYKNYSSKKSETNDQKTTTNNSSGNTSTTTNSNNNTSTTTNNSSNIRTCKNGVFSQADDVCMCNGNWTGDECAECGLICSAGGVLDPTACVCKCNLGYAGKTCEIDISDIN